MVIKLIKREGATWEPFVDGFGVPTVHGEMCDGYRCWIPTTVGQAWYTGDGEIRPRVHGRLCQVCAPIWCELNGLEYR
jgi:hypothetical protein